MPSIDYSLYKQQLVLYLVNVYQPCSAAELWDVMRAAPTGPFKNITSEELTNILQGAQRRGFLLQTNEGQLHLTHLGLRRISERRLAFTRDKNRLFYLKDVL